MTYGLSLFNPSGELVISSEGVGYKYLGNPTLVSSATKEADATFSYTTNVVPYTYTINLPAGSALYPIIGMQINSSTIVEFISSTLIQSTTIDHVYGISGVYRPVDTNTGYMYQTTIGGVRQVGINGGPLSIRNGAVYEWDSLAFYLSGYQVVALSATTHDPLVFTAATLTIEVNSVSATGATSISALTFSTPTLYVFIPYTNSDGNYGYGLNLYNSSGNLTFSSNKPLMLVNQTVNFSYDTATFSTNTNLTNFGQSSSCNYLSNAIILNGPGRGSAEAIRNQNQNPYEPVTLYYRNYGWTYTGYTLQRVPYVTSAYTSGTIGTTSVTTQVQAVTALIADGTNYV